jgi:hypothetical protein
MLSPVWTFESCDLETGMNLEGWRKQLRAARRSEDINNVLSRNDSDLYGSGSGRVQSVAWLGRDKRFTQEMHQRIVERVE